METTTITIPKSMLPADGRFGSGPTKVRAAQVDAIVAGARAPMGNSHRKPPVKTLVGSIRTGLSGLFGLPDGWEVLIGNGGATMFWDAASFGLVRSRSQHLSFGEFSSKFARVTAAAPHLDAPAVIESPPGDHPLPIAQPGVDTYALTHNETSTGVAMTLSRPTASKPDDLVVVDATSAAGGIAWSPDQVDVYYFSPQKCFAADGGLWLAACSPTAIERIEELSGGDRWCPASLDLGIALRNSRANQTYNTPAVATLILLDSQIGWLNGNGGLAWAAERCRTSADTLYGWAEARPWATPFVTDPQKRSPVVATIDLDETIVADDVSAALRANGIVDTEGYRKLGRNQLRIGMFPAIDPADLAALTACIDLVVESLTA